MDATEVPSTIQPDEADMLPVGAMLLRGSYRITRFIASGGFGKTYLAIDNLERTVVIKECFPQPFCRREGLKVAALTRASEAEFQTLLDLFKAEARNLSAVSHPNIVNVHQVFDDNNTAYMVLDYIEGRDLAAAIEDRTTPISPDDIANMAKKLVNAVATIHEAGVLHRDIAPDNILLTASNEPVLIDFGAARHLAASGNRTLSALTTVKDGYSPQEFYSGTDPIDFSSDLYALAASLHHAIVGYPPPVAQERVAAVATGSPDPYTPIATRARTYDRGLLDAIDRALGLFPIERPQSAKEWKQLAMGLRIPNRASRGRAESGTRGSQATSGPSNGYATDEGATAPPMPEDRLKVLRKTTATNQSATAARTVLAASAALAVLGLGAGTLLISFGTETATTVVDRGTPTSTPIAGDVVLMDGTALEQITKSSIPFLRVKEGGALSLFEYGDVLVALMPLGQSIGTARSFTSEIANARAKGATSIEVAVRRGDTVIIVPLDISQNIISQSG